MSIKVVKVSEIDLDDRRFRFTLSRPDKRFLRSVEEIGVLQPVIIVDRQGKTVLVDGWKRLAAAQACGLDELLALVVGGQTEDLAVFLLAFFENYGQRQFSLAEKALAVRRFREFQLRTEDIIRHILPLLELPPERKILDTMLEMSVLDESVLEIIHRKDWKLGTVELLLGFSSSERNWLLSLIEKLTHSQQKEIIENFYSLSKKTGKSPEALAAEEGLEAFAGRLRKGDLSAADRLLAELRMANSPMLFRLNQAISGQIERLELPEKFKLDYDRNLERPALRVSVEAENSQNLKQAIRWLAENLESRDWEKLFQLLNYKGE